MKFIDKSKRPSKSSKPKRQPDPILSKQVKVTKLGSAQRKRVQKRIVSKSNKGKAKEIKKDKNDDVVDSDVEMEEEEDEKDSTPEFTEQELAEIVARNASNPFNFNGDDEVTEMNLNDLQGNGSESEEEEDDVSMEDLKENESIDEIEDNDEDIITNIQAGDNTIKVTDLDSLNSRIQQHMDILNNFKEFKEKHSGNCHPRSYYVDIWLSDLCDRFSYNKFLMNKLYQLFNVELFRFLVASDEDRPMTIRTNSLKTRYRELSDALTAKDCNVTSLPFCKVAMVVHSAKVAIGATSEYLAGHYLLQGGSSMLPVMALAPKPNEKILDMCAAPGGKTTHIAQIMRNTGVLYVNDVDRDRLKAVSGNLARMGVINALVSCHDGRSIHKKVRNVDRVLCDGPCTGTGVISKDKSIKASKDETDLRLLTTTQKQLLCAAIDACKVGGFVVYSTCSVLVEENEQVVDYACRKRNVKIVETGLFGTKGFKNFCSKHFNNNMDRTRRYYPHVNNMDGFFVAKLQKVAHVDVAKKTEAVDE